ncbi:MAG: hypothetical protein ABI345_12205 [Jatrophihabitans sp.]
MTETGPAPQVDTVARPEQASSAADLGLPTAAATALVVGAALVLAALHGALTLLIVIGVVQAGLALCWVYGTGMPGRIGALVIAALASGAADTTVSIWPQGRLGTLLAVLGLAVPVMFVHQLARGAARVQLVSSLSAVALLVLSEVSLAALLQVRHEFGTDLGGRVAAALAGAAAAALLVGALVDSTFVGPRFDPAVARGILGLVASIGIGAAVAHLLLRDDSAFTEGRGVFLGAAVGALAGLLAVATAFVQHTTTSGAGRARLLPPVFAVVLPLCVLSPAGFLLCLAIRA